MKKVQPTLKKLFLVFSREATIVKNTNDKKKKISVIFKDYEVTKILVVVVI